MSINYSGDKRDSKFKNSTLAITATGTTAAAATVAASTIPSNSFYNIVGTCTSAAHGVALPKLPVLGVPYVIKNNGEWTASIFAASTGSASTVDGADAGVAFILGNNGSEVSMVASQATPLTANAADIVWNSFGKSGKGILAIAGADAPTLSACIHYPIQVNLTSTASAPGSITLPNPTTCAGMRVKFIHAVDSAEVVTVVCTGGALINTNWLVTPGANPVYTAATLRTTITWAAASVVGDYQIYESDGVCWSASGMSGAAAGFTNN